MDLDVSAEAVVFFRILDFSLVFYGYRISSVFHSYNFLLLSDSVIQRNNVVTSKKIELHLEKM
jgi:hypothetical protein